MRRGGFRKLPYGNRRHDRGDSKNDEKDRQFLSHRIAGPGHTNPHIRQGDGKPDWYKELRGDGDTRGIVAPELTEEQEHPEQEKPPEMTGSMCMLFSSVVSVPPSVD